MDTAARIRVLESEGMHADEEVVRGILDAREETFPHLARIATYDEYWKAHNAWAPVCAIHLLAKIGHYRAQLAVNAAILDHYEETGDWLTDDAPYILAHMGTGAIPSTTALMRHVGADTYVRCAAAEALVITASKHPEARPGIVASIKDAAQREADDGTRMMLVDSLLDLRDPDLYEYLKDAVETRFIRSDFYDVSTLDQVYAGSLPTSRVDNSMDPMDIFSYRDDYLYGPGHGGPADAPLSLPASRKTGRNEPCPCGSGKKYKKCCMPRV